MYEGHTSYENRETSVPESENREVDMRLRILTRECDVCALLCCGYEWCGMCVQEELVWKRSVTVPHTHRTITGSLDTSNTVFDVKEGMCVCVCTCHKPYCLEYL